MKMLEPVFRAGLGGKIGSGRQWMSCIEIHDLASMVMESLKNPSINGAVNAVMPAPVSNGEFTLAVARAVRRPAIIPAPAFALRLVLGDLSHLLLDSQRVIPKKFGELGFRYHFPSVSSAIQKIVGVRVVSTAYVDKTRLPKSQSCLAAVGLDPSFVHRLCDYQPLGSHDYRY